MPFSFRDKLHHYLTDYCTNNDSSPSYAEITIAMGISSRSKSLITRSLRILEKEGKLILRKEGRRLHIALSDKHLLIIGRISAGMPIEAIADPRPLDLTQLFHGDDHFALEVKGASMRDDGIFDGDIVICRAAAFAKEGDTVVALIDNQTATLKRISYQRKGHITLIPANPAFTAQSYMPSFVTIQGVFIGLLRMNK